MAAVLALAAHRAEAQDTLVPLGATWKYLDDGVGPGTGWESIAFDDSAWSEGPAQLGYGDGDEATVVSFGGDGNAKYVTTWFRHAFDVVDPSAYGSLDLAVVRDDGAVVYLNGVEVFRSNMPAGPIDATTFASSALGGAAESALEHALLSPDELVTGTNVLAVEIHQANLTSSDISFDLRLLGNLHSGAVNVIRGPYLQRAAPDGIVIRWRTDVATDSRVLYGDAPGNLTSTVDDVTELFDHEVPLTSLSPETVYYYAVGSSTETLAGANATTFFRTPPPSGTGRRTRIWVLGDAGTALPSQVAVRDAYAAFAAGHRTDLWLLLGDNAYESGTDSEYQAGIFDIYPTTLAQSPLWPAFGNHDGQSADSATETGPYYEIFTLPSGGEAGGYPSGTEAYYSFDYGNLHLVELDSDESSRSPGGDMLTWLADDLAATEAGWVIAFWHHPPYTKGSHDSDSEGTLVEMRENALPVLENGGVDLVLSGHSHAYERSFLLDGHYGDSSTLSGSMVLDAGDGSPVGDGAYHKATYGPAAHEGTVYVVAGSSGKLTTGPLDHPAMEISLASLGSLVLDFDRNVLVARFVNDAGAVLDTFTMVKGDGPLPCQAGAPDDLVLTDATVVGEEVFEACDSLTAGSSWTVAASGWATLRAVTTTLDNGVSVESGGRLEIESLVPPVP